MLVPICLLFPIKQFRNYTFSTEVTMIVDKYTICRWLGRGSMFVLSGAQARRLLGAAGARAGGRLVDVGAGDGEVSRRFAHLYDDKLATEISSCMRKALKTKGYT